MDARFISVDTPLIARLCHHFDYIMKYAFRELDQKARTIFNIHQRCKKHYRDNIRRRLKFQKVSYSCGCTAEDCEYEVLYIVVIETITFSFVNAYLLYCVRLSKSTKMRQRTAGKNIGQRAERSLGIYRSHFNW